MNSVKVTVDRTEVRRFKAPVIGDSAASAAWSVSPTGTTVADETVYASGSETGASALLGPFAAGDYTVTSLITTTGGQVVKAVWMVHSS
jgi:hypothetical protein